MPRPSVPALIQFGTTINSGSEIGQFGSYNAPIYSNNLTTIMNGTAWPRGWFGAVTNNQRQFIQDQNAMDFVAQAYLFYIMTLGVVEYIAAMTYWLNSIVQVSGQFFISLIDNNTGNTPASSPSAWQSGIPGMEVTGVIKAYAGIVAPAGYLLCNGQVVSQTTYAALYSVCGSSYNTGGEGAGNFRLPNLQANIPVGYLSGDPNFGTLGKILGEAAHTLVVNEIPPLAVPLGADFSNYGSQALFLSRGGNNVLNFATNGGNGSHNNIQQSQVIGSWIVKT